MLEMLKCKEKRYNIDMKITIEEKEFEIDVERAIELGICKRISKIKEIKAGDVFESDMERVMIIQPIYGVEEFNIVGFDGLEPFSDFSELQTRDEMTEFLSEGDYTFIANINDQINELIRSA
jgi:hypothetical protein